MEHRCTSMDGPAEDILGLKTCSRCLKAQYCSAGCMRLHWKPHKAACGKWVAGQREAQTRDASEAAQSAADGGADPQ